ncbi:DUF2061 domain-containing protein [Crocinitomix catalasitica]|uniref:DUF2061 domain-containing protein n=1 Tax=Crocinitomix catalasitica TaxID=184607 RepID=UPI000482B9CE|nr:DUF2061 domain-containing protein [Crocinitomix catalasitica]
MLFDQFLHKKGVRRGDSNAKSILKSVSWRIVGTCDTILIAYILTGNVKMAASIGGIEVFTKMFLYYLHERFWNKYI